MMLTWVLAQALVIAFSGARIRAIVGTRSHAYHDLERASARLAKAQRPDNDQSIWLGPYIGEISRCASKWRLTLLSVRALRNPQGLATSVALGVRSPETAALVGFLEEASRIPGLSAHLDRLPYHNKECDVSVNVTLDSRSAVRAR